MQKKVKTEKRSREELEFLPAALEVLETPPRPAARMIALLISTFFFAAIYWAIAGRIDTVAVAEGQLVPSDRVKLIQPLENGIIRAINVRDGQEVKAGDILISLDPTETAANVEALKSDLTKAKLDESVAAALLNPNPTYTFSAQNGADETLVSAARAQLLGEVKKLQASLALVDSEVEEQRAIYIQNETQLKKAKDTTPLITDRLDGLNQLDKQGLVRKPELLATRRSLIENKSEILSARSGMDQATARIESRNKRRIELIETARSDALQRRAEALRKIASIEQQLFKEQRRQKDRDLKAPVDGTVFGLSIHTVGGVVTTKDVVLRLVPAGSTLELECKVLNKDIGFVQEGQEVEIKLETFPFTRYGLIDGVVKQVWRDAIPDENRGLIYKAEITLKQNKILVGNRWQPLVPGMSAQAEIKTGDRSIISFFLSPFLRYRDEALRER